MKKLMLFLFVLFLTNLSISSDYDGKLELRIKLDKDEFVPWESIYCDLVLKNISDSEIPINRFFALEAPGYLYVFCSGESGNRFRTGAIHASINTDARKYNILPPNDSLLISFEVLLYLGKPDTKLYPRFHQLPEDRYTMYAIFKANPDLMPGIHKAVIDSGIVRSNNLEFMISSQLTTPSSKEELERLHKLYIELRSKPVNLKRAWSGIKNFIRTYPNSKYLDKAFQKLIYASSDEDEFADAVYEYANTY